MSLDTVECQAVALAPGNEVCLEPPPPLAFAEFRGLVREMWLVAWGDLSLSLLKGSFRPEVSRRGYHWHFLLRVEIVFPRDVDSLLEMFPGFMKQWAQRGRGRGE